MGYLYGDSTPFPLDENYIETAHDVTKVCTSLLQADELLEKIRETIARERMTTAGTLEEMKKMSRDLAQAVEPYKAITESAFILDLSVRAAQTVRSLMDRAHQDLTARADALLRKSQAEMTEALQRSTADLEQFLLRHELTKTHWSLSWAVGEGEEPARAQAVATTTLGLEATFDLDVSPVASWTHAPRLSDLKQPLMINLPKKAGWLSRGSVRQVDLARYYLTGIRMTPRDITLVVRRALKSSSSGFEVKVSGDGETAAVVRPLEAESGPERSVVLEEFEASALRELWHVIREQLGPLVRHRVRMVKATLEGTPMREVESPGVLAQRIIKTAAPHVSEIVARSPVAGELALKREISHGQREELFISVRTLTDLYAHLSPKRRAQFDVFGLGPVEPPASEPGGVIVEGVEAEHVEHLPPGEHLEHLPPGEHAGHLPPGEHAEHAAFAAHLAEEGADDEHEVVERITESMVTELEPDEMLAEGSDEVPLPGRARPLSERVDARLDARLDGEDDGEPRLEDFIDEEATPLFRVDMLDDLPDDD